MLLAIVGAVGCGEPTAPAARNEAPPTARTEPASATTEPAGASTEAPPGVRTLPPPEAVPAADGECTITDGEDRSTYTYASGRLQRSTWSRDERVTTYTYEGDRLVRVERRDPREVLFTVTVEHDGPRVREVVRRSTEERLNGPVELVERRTFAYRADGRLERVTTTREHGSEVTTFTYDDRGRLTEQVTGEGEDELRIRYRYDGAGRLERVDAGSQSWGHVYDPSGHVVRTIMVGAGGAVTSVEQRRYDAGGRLVERERDDGLERMRYEGTFGSGAECGMPGPAPEGIPADYDWLGFSP